MQTLNELSYFPNYLMQTFTSSPERCASSLDF